MDKIPFDPYDFFGYLASGLLIIVGTDLVFGIPNVLGKDLKVVDAALLVLATYIVGQIAATPAKALLEDLIVGRILRKPNVNLFQASKPILGTLLFPGFYTELPEQIRNKVRGKAAMAGVADIGETLFLHVRFSPAVLGDDKLMGRLSAFLNKYGFNRNLSFASALVGIAFLIKVRTSSAAEPDLLPYGIIAILISILLFYRYLKFFRQYSFEMFNTYAQKD